MIKKLEEIVTAARKLKPNQFLRLRRELDRLEQSLWEKELACTTKELSSRKVTDQMIDEMVMRRRRESRA